MFKKLILAVVVTSFVSSVSYANEDLKEASESTVISNHVKLMLRDTYNPGASLSENIKNSPLNDKIIRTLPEMENSHTN